MAYHELRSPLALVATVARSAAAECEDDLLRARCLSIVRATERMLRTASHLMVVAETSTEDGTWTLDPMEVVSRVSNDYRGVGANVAVHDLRSGFNKVSFSASALEALLCSLMGNALDHGARESAVSIVVTNELSACQIRITNGVAEGSRHHGLGLGAYIAGKLAEEMGATLSTERTGDTFTSMVSLSMVSERVGVAV